MAIVYAAPVLSIGSLIWFAFLSNHGFFVAILLGTIGFVGFMYVGMFARGIAHKLHTERRR